MTKEELILNIMLLFDVSLGTAIKIANVVDEID